MTSLSEINMIHFYKTMRVIGLMFIIPSVIVLMVVLLCLAMPLLIGYFIWAFADYRLDPPVEHIPWSHCECHPDAS